MDVSANDQAAARLSRPWLLTLCAACVALIALGLAGSLPVGWGYGLFLVAGLLLLAGTIVFGVFALSRWGDTRRLRTSFGWLLKLGASSYVLSLAALTGAYGRDALLGRVEWYWIAFGPSILAALIVLDVGLYRKLVRNNLPTWRRYQPYISRDRAQPAALRRTLVDEVLLQRTLFKTSRIRWLRHALIFWGFTAMFVTELVAVIVRDGFPAFGWQDVWRETGHPVRVVFAFIYDFTGVMIVLGCVLALAWRVAVAHSPERKYSDTPTTVFLLFVVASGFIVEALRIAPTVGDPAHFASFAGVAVARLLSVGGLVDARLNAPVWLIHVLASCVFIAYVPVARLIHSCATPMGRLMNSQKQMLADKKRGVLAGMLLPGARDAPNPGAALSRPR